MAIPIRATLTCPQCGISEDITFADTSVGPQGRTSATPTFSMLKNPAWPQSRRTENGKTVTMISCAECGTSEFTSLPELACQESIRN